MSTTEHLSFKPNIRLWIFNHPIKGISDQIDFFVYSCRQEGYCVTVSKRPCKYSLNVIIEGLGETRKERVINFCQSMDKRIAVIMTEHLDWSGGKLFVHGNPLHCENDYVESSELALRIRMLSVCRKYTNSFLGLGDLPELNGIDQYFPDIPVHRIAFPKLELARTEMSEEQGDFRQELVFTGNMTEHRAHVLDTVRSEGLSIYHPERILSHKKRDKLNKEAKIVVNIPQNETWRWLSPMRILAALRIGRATVSLGTTDESKISSCCMQLNLRNKNWTQTLRECCVNWRNMYAEAHQSYSEMAASYKKNNRFPHKLFNDWAKEEHIDSKYNKPPFGLKLLAGFTGKWPRS